LLRVLLHARRLRRLQVDFPASDPRRSGGGCWCGLCDISVAAVRELPLPLQPGARRRRVVAGAVAPGVRRERSTMERASLVRPMRVKRILKGIVKWTLRLVLLALVLGSLLVFIAYWRSTNDCDRKAGVPV